MKKLTILVSLLTLFLSCDKDGLENKYTAYVFKDCQYGKDATHIIFDESVDERHTLTVKDCEGQLVGIVIKGRFVQGRQYENGFKVSEDLTLDYMKKAMLEVPHNRTSTKYIDIEY